MHAALLGRLAIETDGHEHRNELTVAAPGVIVGELLGIAKHLVDVGGFGGDPVLELDDEHDAVFEGLLKTSDSSTRANRAASGRHSLSWSRSARSVRSHAKSWGDPVSLAKDVSRRRISSSGVFRNVSTSPSQA